MYSQPGKQLGSYLKVTKKVFNTNIMLYLKNNEMYEKSPTHKGKTDTGDYIRLILLYHKRKQTIDLENIFKTCTKCFFSNMSNTFHQSIRKSQIVQ